MGIQRVKKPSDSKVISTYMVMPDDTNFLGYLLGGRLLHWMDLTAAIVAQKHSERAAVTVAVDNVEFNHPIGLGDVVTITGWVTRAFTTSMEIYIDVWAENIPRGKRYHATSAFYTFVAIDAHGKPIPVPAVQPETEQERYLYETALLRREFRLFMAGRINIKTLDRLVERLREVRSHLAADQTSSS